MESFLFMSTPASFFHVMQIMLAGTKKLEAAITIMLARFLLAASHTVETNRISGRSFLLKILMGLTLQAASQDPATHEIKLKRLEAFMPDPHGSERYR